jgi:hypothetical protein
VASPATTRAYRTRFPRSRRWALACLLAAGVGLTIPGCRGVPAGAPPLARPVFGDPPRRPGRPLILIAMPDSPAFHLTRKAVVRELEDDLDVITAVVGATTRLSEFAAKLAELRPTCLLLLDNPALALYQHYAETQPDSEAVPPAVVAMTPFFIEELRRIRNTTGVAYEVPGVTAFVKLRSVVTRPVRRVAVVHRPRFRQFIDRQARLAAKEDITLVALEVGDDPTATEVRAALGSARDADVDALWVLSDRRLLKSVKFINEVWRPQINLFRIPVVVGLASLVATKAEFASFAVVPDHEELGVQTARLILRVAESGWRADQHPVELPISTLTLANIARLREHGGLKPDAASQIDERVE